MLIDFNKMFFNNIGHGGGPAPVRAYISELMADIIAGKIDLAPVLTMTVGLNGVSDGYAAMDQRKAIKVMVQS